MDWKQFKGRVNREIRSKVVSTIMAVVIHPQQPCEQFLAAQRSASWHSSAFSGTFCLAFCTFASASVRWHKAHCSACVCDSVIWIKIVFAQHMTSHNVRTFSFAGRFGPFQSRTDWIGHHSIQRFHFTRIFLVTLDCVCRRKHMHEL